MWKERLIFKYICPKNQTKKAAMPTWFQSPRMATWVIRRCILASHDQSKIWFLNFWGAQLLNKGHHLNQDNYYNSVELSAMLLE